jgi:hypothetical protein
MSSQEDAVTALLDAMAEAIFDQANEHEDGPGGGHGWWRDAIEAGREVAEVHIARLTPTAAVRGAARADAKDAIHQALHTLNVRIVGIDAGDCHCNLVAQVVLDALELRGM